MIPRDDKIYVLLLSLLLLSHRLSFEFSESLLNHLSYTGTKLNLQIQHAGVPLTYKVK